MTADRGTAFAQFIRSIRPVYVIALVLLLAFPVRSLALGLPLTPTDVWVLAITSTTGVAVIAIDTRASRTVRRSRGEAATMDRK